MKNLKYLTSVVAIGLLAACGGSSTGNSNAFVLASAGDGIAGSGLPFATVETDQALEDLAIGDSFQVRVAGYQNLQGETTLTPTLTTETVTFVDDGSGGVAVEMSYRGETLTFNLDQIVDFDDDSDTLASGQDVTVYLNTPGDASQTFGIYTYVYGDDEPADGGLNAESFFAAGFETDPTTVAARSGTASFEGVFDGYGGIRNISIDDVLNEVEVEGSIDFEVSFADASISGTLEGFIDNGAEADFTGTLASVPISGNNFEGDLDISCTDGVTCTSDSQLGGAFFGADADEVAGLIAFDFTGVSEDGTELQLVSGAGFVAVERGPVE